MVLIGGDFNCCPDERNRSVFPEVEESPELVDPSAHWIDVGRDLGVRIPSDLNDLILKLYSLGYLWY